MTSSHYVTTNDVITSQNYIFNGKQGTTNTLYKWYVSLAQCINNQQSNLSRQDSGINIEEQTVTWYCMQKLAWHSQH
jgi:hypothetical protein